MFPRATGVGLPCPTPFRTGCQHPCPPPLRVVQWPRSARMDDLHRDPAGRPCPGPDRVGLLAVRQGTWRAACSAAAVLLAAVAVIVACLVLAGVGVYLMPPVLAGLRALANAARRRIGVAEIPQPAGPASGWSAGLAACRRAFRAPATRRDLIWAAGDWPVGVTLGLLPALLLAGGLWGLSAPLTWRWATEAWDGSWFLFVPLISDVTAALAAVVGVALLAAGLIFAPWLGRLSDAWAARLLGPSTVTRLTERVEHLATTRADTLDAQQSEIRRIERDLHDGAQARLMAMGMTLKMMERHWNATPRRPARCSARPRRTPARPCRSSAIWCTASTPRSSPTGAWSTRSGRSPWNAGSRPSRVHTDRQTRTTDRVGSLLHRRRTAHKRGQARRRHGRSGHPRHHARRHPGDGRRQRARRSGPVPRHRHRRRSPPSCRLRRHPHRRQPTGGPTRIDIFLPMAAS